MPRTPEQFSAMREKSRLAIVNAAIKLFARNGYTQTTVADLAQEAGISKGLVYHFYKSKEEILDALLDEYLRIIMPPVAPVATKAEARAFLEEMIHRWFGIIRTNPDIIRLGVRCNTDPDLLKLMRKKLAVYMKKIFPLGLRVMELLGSRHPKEDLYFLGTIFDGIAVNFVSFPDLMPFDFFERRMIDQLALFESKH